MRVGSVIHDKFFNALGNDIKVFEKADGRTKEGKAKKAEMEAYDLYLIDTEVDMVESVIASLRANMNVSAILDRSTYIEHYAIAEIQNEQDPENPIKFKFKPDIVGPDFIADLKTTSDVASDENIIKLLKYNHYLFQAGSYLSLDWLLTGSEMKPYFYFIFAETFAPYRVRVVNIDYDTLMLGVERFEKVIKKYIKGINNPETPDENFDVIKTIELKYY